MSHPWTRSSRARSLTLVTVLLAALGVLSLFVAQAGAAPLTGSPNPLPGSNFEGGDANQEASAPKLDWANAPFVDHAPDPNAGDNIFAGGAEGKENNPGNWNFATQDGGSTPGKNNILDAYSEVEPDTNDVFLHLAFTRGSDTGTTYMAFELNQRANLWNNGKVDIPCRTTGDIIVSYQVSGNSPDVILQKWTSSTSDAATGCATTGTLTDYTAVVDNVDAQGAVNAAPIQNFLASSYPWPGNTIPAKLFGEASLNLTSLLSGALGTPCFSFGSIWMHTRASTSDSSNLDDYIAPRPLLVRNCSAGGTKFHDLDADGVKDEGEPGLAGFRMWADYDNDGVRDAGEPFGDTDPDGDYVITNIQDPSGTYSIREQLTEGGGTGGWTCSYPATTGTGGDFPCAYTGIDGAATPNVTGADFGNYQDAVVKVEKQTVPDGAAGSFEFASTIPGKGSFDLGDGDVESTTVTPGTYTATESAHPDFDLTGIACTDDDSSGADHTATFRAQSGETITCTFTNTRKTGQLTVRKVLDPADDGGTFDLKIGDDLVVDDGGHLAEGSRTLPTGNGYAVSEEAGAGTSLAKYSSAVECRDGETVVASGSGTSLAGVPVIAGQNVICTFTNTRKPGTIEVVKDLVPNDDEGTFDLKVGDDVVKAGASDGEGGSTSVAPGTYTVSETGAGGTSLAKYDASIECKDGDAVVASGSGASLGGVAVDSNQTIVCTITNERRAGKLTVVKDLEPATDGGRFDLRIGSDVVKAGAGDGDSGSKQLAPGDYDVSEVAADGTSLAKYDTSIACDNGQNGTGTSLAGVHVDSDDDITCTITNTRREGSITVIKDLVPADDDGTFDLKVGDDVVAAGVGDGGQGGKDVAPDTYTVSEAGAAGTSLAKYDKAIACTRNGQPAESGDGASLDVAVDSNDTVVCTITNQRRGGTLEVVKELKPADDGGTFDLRIGDDVVAAGVGDGGSGDKAVAPGDYTVSEAGAGGTSLAKYDTSIACDNGQNGTGTSLAGVHVDSDETVVCTITNERRPGSITVIKELVPAADSGTFDLEVGDDVVAAGVGDGGQGDKDVAPGTYAVSEAGAGGTSLADYDTSIACDNGLNGPGTSLGGIAVDSDEAVVCTITNVRLGSVTVSKTEGGEDPDRTWTFRLTGGPDAVSITKDTATDGTLSFGHLKPGDYRLCEVDLPAGWHSSLGPVVDGEACVDLEIEAGESEEVAVDNTRPATIVIKEGDAFVHHGDSITYTFDVSNDGNTPLEDVTVVDDRCDAAPVYVSGDADGDGWLAGSEVWRFTCTKAVGAHAADEENPILNVATAHAVDKDGNEVTDTDDHSTTIIHPGIAVNKELRRSGDAGYRDGDAGDAPLPVHRGDTIEYRFTVTNTGDTPLTVAFSDPKCDAQPAGPDAGDANGDGKLDTDETWTYLCSHVVTNTDADPLDNTVTVTGTDRLGGEKGTVTATDTERADIITPQALVVKEGNKVAYPGDTVTFTFAVTNAGDTPLHDVKVTDNRCAPVTGPTEKRNGNADDLLDPGETWIFTCAKQIPANHKIGDENPITNVATATGTDPLGKKVESSDDHKVTVLHPAIDIEKTGPATAAVGAPLGYTLTVTNPGDVSFAVQDVVVTDPRCEAPPAGPGTGADATPGRLDPGDTWTYTCTAQTTGQPAGTFVNTATVTAKDANGRTVTDTDDFPTVLEAQGVLPEEIVSGVARLRGPSGCVKKAFKATVRGRRIARVTFYVDGKKRKRIVAKSRQRVFRVKVRPGSAVGVHRVTARVVFKKASRTKARTLRLTYRRCARQVVTPQFTG